MALAVLSLVLVSYNSSASALVADLVLDHLRGVYLSVNSLCWTAGFALGPMIGGMVLDLPQPWASGLWIFLVITVSWVWGLLCFLNPILPCKVNRAAVPLVMEPVPLGDAER